MTNIKAIYDNHLGSPKKVMIVGFTSNEYGQSFAIFYYLEGIYSKTLHSDKIRYFEII